MDTLKFEVETLFYHFPTVNIYINGRSLRGLVNWAEQDNRLARGEVTGPSHYIGLDPDELLHHARSHFLEPRRDGGWNRWVMACTCPVTGCLGVTARIAVYTDTVHWSDICNPWLARLTQASVAGTKKPQPFDYSAIRPFTFDLIQYARALAELEERLCGWQ